MFKWIRALRKGDHGVQIFGNKDSKFNFVVNLSIRYWWLILLLGLATCVTTATFSPKVSHFLFERTPVAPMVLEGRVQVDKGQSPEGLTVALDGPLSTQAKTDSFGRFLLELPVTDSLTTLRVKVTGEAVLPLDTIILFYPDTTSLLLYARSKPSPKPKPVYEVYLNGEIDAYLSAWMQDRLALPNCDLRVDVRSTGLIQKKGWSDSYLQLPGFFFLEINYEKVADSIKTGSVGRYDSLTKAQVSRASVDSSHARTKMILSQLENYEIYCTHLAH